MEKKDLLEKVTEVFRDVLDNEDIELNYSSCANDIEEWDSLSHVQLVVAIEHEFGIKFTAKEIMSWQNIDDMLESIISKM